MVESARTVQLPASSTPTIWDRLAQALSPIEERPRIAHTIESAHHRARDGSRYGDPQHDSTHVFASGADRVRDAATDGRNAECQGPGGRLLPAQRSAGAATDRATGSV